MTIWLSIICLNYLNKQQKKILGFKSIFCNSFEKNWVYFMNIHRILRITELKNKEFKNETKKPTA